MSTATRARQVAGSALLAASLVTSLFVAAGCYPKAAGAPPPLSAAGVDRAVARWPGTAPASLATGRELFVAKCNGCHGYPDLAAIQDDRWPSIVKSMAGKAHLGPAEGEAVLHFILASRSDPTGS